jgi:hypothetical protein
MVNEQSKNSSIVMVIAVAILAVVVFVAGFYVGQMNDKNNTTLSGLTGADKNYLSQLEFVGGFCERQGLISAIVPQQLLDGNVVGVPVCRQR